MSDAHLKRKRVARPKAATEQVKPDASDAQKKARKPTRGDVRYPPQLQNVIRESSD